jgi:branched-chain amino acid aminotransferase
MPWTNYAYVDGRFVPENEATISIFDRGFLYGDGVFETMPVYGGKIFRLAEHLKRLFSGVSELKFASPLSDEEAKAMLEELISRNGVLVGSVRLYLTRGAGDVGLSAKNVKHPTAVAVTRHSVIEPQSIVVSAIIANIRVGIEAPLARIKTANRLPYVLAKLEAGQAGAHEAVLLNAHGRVVEFTASNLFVVKKGELFTPPLTDGPLPGITRDIVLMLAAQQQIPACELSFGAEFFTDADEVLATNSLIEIAHLLEIDGRSLDQSSVAERLRSAYQQLVVEELGLY